MTTTINDIKSKDWGFDIEKLGAVVEDISDINQCIYIILMTVKGTDPLRPDFGCDIFKWIDRPVNEAIPNMIKEAVLAINKYEPRVVVTRIVPKIDVSNVSLRIEWETVSSTEIGSIQVTYGN